MHRFLFAITLLPALSAPAQQLSQQPVQPPAGSNWQHVQALPAGTTIYVNTSDKTVRCKLTSVDGDTLTCAHGKPIAFQRANINTIKLPRRTLSTAILAGAGAGLGAVVVKGVAASLFGDFNGGRAKGTVYAGGAGIGAVVFGPIGYFTDFARSTIYKAQ